jgi:WD40 repeat protein
MPYHLHHKLLASRWIALLCLITAQASCAATPPAVTSPTTPLAATPAPTSSFVKARLDHVGPDRLGDDHWLDPAAIRKEDDTHTLTGSPSRYVRLWDNATADLRWETQLQQPISDLTLIDAASVVVLTDKDIIALSMRDGAELRRSPLPADGANASHRALLLGGQLFTVTRSSHPEEDAGQPPIVRLWSLADQKILQTFQPCERDCELELYLHNDTLTSIGVDTKEQSTVRAWSLTDQKILYSLDIAPQLYRYSQEEGEDVSIEYRNKVYLNPDATYAAWVSTSSPDAQDSVLSLSALSRPGEVSTATLRGVNVHVEYGERSILFSPDGKTLALIYSGQHDMVTVFADIDGGALKNIRQHTTPAQAPKEYVEGFPDDEEDESYIELSSATFSADNAQLFMYFSHVFFPYRGTRGAEDISRVDDAISLTVATGKPSKTKPPAPPSSEDEDTADAPARPPIPPPQLAEKYLQAWTPGSWEIPLSSTHHGEVFSGLIVNRAPLIWPIGHEAFLLPPQTPYIFDAQGRLIDFESAVISDPERGCELTPQDSSIGVWELKTRTRQILHAEPQLIMTYADALADGQIEVTFLHLEMDSCSYHEGDEEAISAAYEAGAIREGSAVFNPRDQTFSIRSESDSGLDSASATTNRGAYIDPTKRYAEEGETREDEKYYLFLRDRVTGEVALAPDVEADRISLSLDAKRAVFVSDQGVAHVFDMQTRGLISTLTIPPSKHVLLSADSDALIIADQADVVVMDVKTQKAQVISEHTKPIIGMILSGDGQTLFSVQDDGITIAWDWPAIRAALAAQ